MNKRTNAIPLRLAGPPAVALAVLVAMLVTMVAGCESKGVRAGSAPPPPPPPRSADNQTYDFTHHVQTRITSPRWAVAILRFGDLPPTPPTAAPPPGTATVTVQPAGPVQPAPQINQRGRDVLKHALVQSKAFTVVERERIVELIREINFAQTDLVDPATSPEAGRLIAVRYFIEGSVGPNEDPTLKGAIPADADLGRIGEPGGLENVFDPTRGNTANQATVFRELRERALRDAARATFNTACYLSVYEVHSGTVVATVMGLGANGAAAINDAVDELVLQLSRNRTEPRIAAVIKERIYLDVGESEVQVGQQFDVVRRDSPIRDRSGQVIGYEETAIGRIEVVAVQPLMSIARPLAGANFQRGQLCRAAKTAVP